ncbi:hypothetical protein L195_g002260 [Trifolium pratense]|uniref:Uncharacterized protein n=1 Tax=Trifolium pratense TaxID=57577 RepID=A0A2K3NRZ6_TRIPR|nr:hypothetical protein L195_g002260 [Trifolium pratense]
MSLTTFVASTSLTTLLKFNGEIHPIAVCTIGRGDVEIILHSACKVLSEWHEDDSLAMFTVNFSNAFDMVDRLAPTTRGDRR